ncbi:MAG: DUF1003 domain-containing protein [Oscillospiraceae bacterium]
MDKYELLGFVLDDIGADMTNEEVMHLLISEKISANEKPEKITFGEKASDVLATFAGSWTFVISFVLILILWIIVNSVFLINSFDPFPFILLNLVLSCIAAVQAPLIMMSQKRQEHKDRQRSKNDYRVNLKSEIILEDLHHKLDRLLEIEEENQKKLNNGNNIE